jgi:hypothetical protein
MSLQYLDVANLRVDEIRRQCMRENAVRRALKQGAQNEDKRWLRRLGMLLISLLPKFDPKNTAPHAEKAAG